MGSTSKRNTTVSVRADVLEEAKALGINVSAALEARLVELIRAARAEAWQRENAEAIESYNRRIESRGAFGDAHRRF